MDGLSSLMHPVTLVYMVSFASMFVWPTITPQEPGEPCRDIATDWFNLVVSIFTNTLAHSIYCLWLIERVVHHYSKQKKPDEPMLNVGEALSRGGSLGSWCAYFGMRVALPAVVTLVLFAAEHKCTLRYEQMLGSMLFADATFTVFMFAASWSGERLGKDAEKMREVMSKAAKETHEGEEKKKKKKGKKGVEESREVPEEEAEKAGGEKKDD